MINNISSERIETLDVLRGIALIGIMLVNISLMKSLGLWNYSFGIAKDRAGVDKWLELIINLFVEGSFITIFSFLFGVGFYIFMNRAQKKGARVYLLFSRRLLFLALFGAGHLIFLWMGDILLYYAITGFLLLFFYRRKNKTILITGIISITSFFLLLASQMFMPAAMINDIKETGHSFVQDASIVYGTAPSMEWFLFRLQHEVPHVLTQVIFLFPYILGLFLFGFYAGRKKWFHQPERHLLLFKRMARFGFLGFVPFAVVLICLETGFLSGGIYQSILHDIVLRMGSIILAFSYISIITLSMKKYKQTWLVKRFAAMGKMALTNYLMQTIIALTVIYGFNWFNQMSLWQGLLLSIIIIVFQMVTSFLWLQIFHFGPMEWLWRKLTYGRSNKNSLLVNSH